MQEEGEAHKFHLAQYEVDLGEGGSRSHWCDTINVHC